MDIFPEYAGALCGLNLVDDRIASGRRCIRVILVLKGTSCSKLAASPLGDVIVTMSLHQVFDFETTLHMEDSLPLHFFFLTWLLGEFGCNSPFALVSLLRYILSWASTMSTHFIAICQRMRQQYKSSWSLLGKATLSKHETGGPLWDGRPTGRGFSLSKVCRTVAH